MNIMIQRLKMFRVRVSVCVVVTKVLDKSRKHVDKKKYKRKKK